MKRRTTYIGDISDTLYVALSVGPLVPPMAEFRVVRSYEGSPRADLAIKMSQDTARKLLGALIAGESSRFDEHYSLHVYPPAHKVTLVRFYAASNTSIKMTEAEAHILKTRLTELYPLDAIAQS